MLPRGKEEADAELPPLKAGQTLTLDKLEKEQKFTQPPARYSEASLVRELEELGIGRPSTYAAIISTLQDRDYVHLAERHFVPTDLGRVVCRQLTEHFAKLMDVGFTAQMEEGLDKVAEGGRNWVDLMRAFAADFNPTLDAAAKNMQSLKGGLPTDLPCPDCGKPLLIKFGKAGAFLACSGYPECRYTSNFARTEDGKVEAVAQEKPQYEKVGQCPRCGKDLVIKKSRTGSRFIACTGYPACDYAAPFSTACPARVAAKAPGGKEQQARQDLLLLRPVPPVRFRSLGQTRARTVPALRFPLSGGEKEPGRGQDHLPGQGLRLCEGGRRCVKVPKRKRRLIRPRKRRAAAFRKMSRPRRAKTAWKSAWPFCWPPGFPRYC